VRALPELRFPHVYLNRAVEGSGRNVVARDARASELALEHLAALGHTAVALVGGPPGLSTVRERSAGFSRAAQGLDIDPAPILPAPFTEEGGAEAARAILALEPRPTAICVNLLGQAVGVLSALWEAGVDVPGEISIVCYDDLPLAAHLRPALTRIDMPLAALGALGVDAAIDQRLGEAPRDLELEVDPVLIEGGSTARPPVLQPAQTGSR
jgi:LacI family transcriptional regulator